MRRVSAALAGQRPRARRARARTARLEAKICIGSDRILSRKETARFPEIGKLERLTRDGIAPE